MAAPARRFTLSRAAAADLESIYRFGVERRGVRQAERYQDALFEAFADLASGLRPGRPLLDAYLKLSVGSHFVVFREDDLAVYVTRVLHQRMDLDRHLRG